MSAVEITGKAAAPDCFHCHPAAVFEDFKARFPGKCEQKMAHELLRFAAELIASGAIGGHIAVKDLLPEFEAPFRAHALQSEVEFLRRGWSASSGVKQ